MMKDNNILETIKNKNSQKALKEMEEIFKEILSVKLNQTEASNKSFMGLVDDCIRTFPEDYDILTYLKNTYFFSEKTDTEKLYELAYIYENLNEDK